MKINLLLLYICSKYFYKIFISHGEFQQTDLLLKSVTNTDILYHNIKFKHTK